MRELFEGGQPSNDVARVGLTVHGFDGTEESPSLWKPCTKDAWCKNSGKWWPASIITSKSPRTASTSGILLSPTHTRVSCILSANASTPGAGCDAGAGIEPANRLKSALASRSAPHSEVLIDAGHYADQLPASIAGVFYYSDAEEPEKIEATKLYLALLRAYGLKEESMALLSIGRNDSAVSIVDESNGAQNFLRRHFYEKSLSQDRSLAASKLRDEKQKRLEVHTPAGRQREWQEEQDQQEWQQQQQEEEKPQDEECSEKCVDVPPPSDWNEPTCAGQLSNGLCAERVRIADGWCKATCGICVPCKAPAPSPAPEQAEEDGPAPWQDAAAKAAADGKGYPVATKEEAEKAAAEKAAAEKAAAEKAEVEKAAAKKELEEEAAAEKAAAVEKASAEKVAAEKAAAEKAAAEKAAAKKAAAEAAEEEKAAAEKVVADQAAAEKAAAEEAAAEKAAADKVAAGKAEVEKVAAEKAAKEKAAAEKASPKETAAEKKAAKKAADEAAEAAAAEKAAADKAAKEKKAEDKAYSEATAEDELGAWQDVEGGAQESRAVLQQGAQEVAPPEAAPACLSIQPGTSDEWCVATCARVPRVPGEKVCPDTICVCGEQPAAGQATDETGAESPAAWQPPAAATDPPPPAVDVDTPGGGSVADAWTFTDDNLECQMGGLAVPCLTKSCAAYGPRDGVDKVGAASNPNHPHPSPHPSPQPQLQTLTLSLGPNPYPKHSPNPNSNPNRSMRPGASRAVAPRRPTAQRSYANAATEGRRRRRR